MMIMMNDDADDDDDDADVGDDDDDDDKDDDDDFEDKLVRNSSCSGSQGRHSLTQDLHRVFNPIWFWGQ